MSKTPKAPPPIVHKPKRYARAVLVDGGHEVMAWAVDFNKMGTAPGAIQLTTYHTGVQVIVPKDKLVLILEPQDPDQLTEFQEKDQLFP